MKLTIIPSDKAVYKDNKSYLGLTLSGIPSDVHALQWDNDAGWIEYKDHAKPNEYISSLPQWVNDIITIWQNAYDAEEAAKLEAEKEAKLITEKMAQQEGTV
jgi:hypothetical protein